jgi:ribosome production factor 1
MTKLTKNPSEVKNKVKRKELVQREREQKKKEIRKDRKARDAAGEPKRDPVTTDMRRIVTDDVILENNQDLNEEEDVDEFSQFIKGLEKAKILITTNERPTNRSFEFLQDLKNLIPNSFYYPRKKFSLTQIAKVAHERDFTHLLTINERLKEPHSLSFSVIGKPPALGGPTFTFRLRKYTPSYEIYNKGNPTGHDPELIFKNFNSCLGRRVSRGIASMFTANPEFKARTVVTFHNQRDFIFVRHHRYVFKNEEVGDSENKPEKGKELKTVVNLQEIGPRFVLQPQKVYSGSFDETHTDYEFLYRADYYVKRSKFYL